MRREAVCNHKRDGGGCKGERVEIVCRGKKNERFINANGGDDDDEARSQNGEELDRHWGRSGL